MDASGRLGRCLLAALVLVAAWASGRAGVPSASTGPVVTWKDAIEVASGPAFRGPWRMNESEFHFVDDPTVALDARGQVGVAWADHSGKDIFFQRYGTDGTPQLAAPVNVSRSPRTFSWLPRLVVTHGEPAAIHVLWQEIVFSGGSHGGEIFFARSTDGGRSFSDPINLSNTIAGAGKGRLTSRYWHNGSLDLVVSESALYAAWTEYEGALWLRRSADGGKSFSRKIRIHDAKPARAPALAVHGNTVYLAWTVGDDQSADIRAAKSSDGGASFGAPVIVDRSKGYSDAPKLAVDGNGTLHLAYGESERGLFAGRHVRYARSTDGGRSFAAHRACQRR